MTTQLLPRGLVTKALFAPKKDIVGTFIIDEICPKPLSAAKAYLHREIKAILCLKLYLPQSDTIEIFLFSFIITLAFCPSFFAPNIKKFSFDYYDSVLCGNNYHITNLRQLEKDRNSKEWKH